MNQESIKNKSFLKLIICLLISIGRFKISHLNKFLLKAIIFDNFFTLSNFAVVCAHLTPKIIKRKIQIISQSTREKTFVFIFNFAMTVAAHKKALVVGIEENCLLQIQFTTPQIMVKRKAVAEASVENKHATVEHVCLKHIRLNCLNKFPRKNFLAAE